MVGLIALLVQYIDDVALVILTITFGSLVLAGIGTTTDVVHIHVGKSDGSGHTLSSELLLPGLAVSVTAFCLLSALYSDWALAIMTKRFIGLPSEEVPLKLYVVYMIAKRLPMFSM